MDTIFISQGRVIDPSQNLDKVTNIFIKDGKIEFIANKSVKADVIINAKDLIVCPGLIDMHVHFREHGKAHEESIKSGSAAAVYSGFTSVACMPNTDPPVDTEAAAEFVYLQSKRTRMANVYPIGAATKGRKGEELSEMGQLYRGGAVAFSDDGNPIQSAKVMMRVLQYASMFDKAVVSHCEEKTLTNGGVMNSGVTATLLGMKGIPTIAEEIMVHRDITLAKAVNGILHIAHVSSAGSVELIRNAKKQGLRVTAEVTPHHLLLTDKEIKSFDTNYKMNPPLRTKKDIEALIEGLKDNTIDVIASDHAPHTAEEKDVEFNNAPFGIIGLETTLPLMLTHLVHTNILSINELIKKFTINPAVILGINKGTLHPGADADITIIDMNKKGVIQPDSFKSKSRNTPFGGWKYKGKAVKTIVSGKIFDIE